MGQRLRLLWHLGVTGAGVGGRPGDTPEAPAVVVAPVRALLQRLGPVDVAASTGDGQATGRPGRPRGPGGPAGGPGVPAGVPGRAPGGGLGAGRDRRRVPVHVGPARADRPVGRRGRPAHRVRPRRPAVGDRPRERRALRMPGGAPHRGGAGPGPGAGRARALGPGPVGAVGRGPALRRDGVVAAVAVRRRPGAARPARSRAPGWCSSIPGGCGTGRPS